VEKMEQDLKNMASADVEWEDKYGERTLQGEENEKMLEKYRKYLSMEIDEEPNLGHFEE
jgi:hypothetical protein